LAPRAAVRARAVRPAEPWHADAPPVVGAADDLMSRNERQLRIGELAVDDVKVGAADGADFDRDTQLPFARRGWRHVRQLERLACTAEQHGPHECSVARESRKSTASGFLASFAATATLPRSPPPPPASSRRRRSPTAPRRAGGRRHRTRTR